MRKEKFAASLKILRLCSQKSECFLSVSTNIYYFTKLSNCCTVIGVFNMEPSNTILKHFLDSSGLYYLVKRKASIKYKGSSIDRIQTDRNYFLKNTHIFENGHSDHHYVVHIMLKTTFQKSEPKQLVYRDSYKFPFKSFKNELS